MSAESLPAALARLVGQHPAALRTVRWVSSAPADSSSAYLEIETKHGLVVIIDPATGAVSANPPQPAQTSASSVRLQHDLTEQVPVAFDGRPRLTAIVRMADRGYRFELSTGAAFSLLPDDVVPSCTIPPRGRPA